ncbi:MAG: hypothetical protein D3922_13930 [Candidatus Electrothrix sp. AR1]|nr:hypothetical protein [Candidatus Electrothrix sp. AR1]
MSNEVSAFVVLKQTCLAIGRFRETPLRKSRMLYLTCIEPQFLIYKDLKRIGTEDKATKIILHPAPLGRDNKT